ncbi:hypothetical protein UFOVP115_30 [uncultured Caudovirales phage]|uniref:Uncharacterized protein n=1 Tax=uncultured Caudovirales phage TaxID=2100421 RepID=A0A6J5L8C1_9CAUD|nr:hypothetical protein UFOVP115_30 [uncultured Caudovirales phage]
MTASYPSALKTFTTKVDGSDYVKADDVNSLQNEVTAIETALGANVATTLIPANVGTYNSAGVSTSLSARVGNLEAGLTGNATDGTRVGYTQLDQKTITTGGSTGTAAFTSISGSYRKLVLQIGLTAYTAPGALTLTINGVSTNYVYTINTYGTATPSTSTASTSWPLGAPQGTAYSVVVELPNYASTFGGKNMNLLGTAASGTGYLATSTITSLTVSAASSTMTVQCTLLGVK